MTSRELSTQACSVVELTEDEARAIVGGPTAVEYAVMLARTMCKFSLSQPQYYS